MKNSLKLLAISSIISTPTFADDIGWLDQVRCYSKDVYYYGMAEPSYACYDASEVVHHNLGPSRIVDFQSDIVGKGLTFNYDLSYDYYNSIYPSKLRREERLERERLERIERERLEAERARLERLEVKPTPIYTPIVPVINIQSDDVNSTTSEGYGGEYNFSPVAPHSITYDIVPEMDMRNTIVQLTVALGQGVTIIGSDTSGINFYDEEVFGDVHVEGVITHNVEIVLGPGVTSFTLHLQGNGFVATLLKF